MLLSASGILSFRPDGDPLTEAHSGSVGSANQHLCLPGRLGECGNYRVSKQRADNPQKSTEGRTSSPPLESIETHVSKANTRPHLQWVKQSAHCDCSKFTALCFVPPVFVERVKQYQYHYKFSSLRGFNQTLPSVCSPKMAAKSFSAYKK